jgi:3D (Asp-Asp-Asp) domain-containing protein
MIRVKVILAALTILMLIIPTEKTSQIQELQPTQSNKVANAISSMQVKAPEIKLPKFTSLGTFKVTAYCPCVSCSDHWGTQTSTGTTATQGKTIAVDPKIIPYGSKIMFGGKVYIAEDCGSAIKNNKIDLYFDSHQDALNWGIQYHEIFILVKEE